MTFDEYQKLALRTAAMRPNELFHRVLGLAGEVGEISEKFKKWVRDDMSDESKIDKQDLEKELGDVLWYTAMLADYFGLSLDKIAQKNIAKLTDRNHRGKLAGSGDYR
jgi:NTP pyrophosphatase (non-canonical NTP hydrolase)